MLLPMSGGNGFCFSHWAIYTPSLTNRNSCATEKRRLKLDILGLATNIAIIIMTIGNRLITDASIVTLIRSCRKLCYLFYWQFSQISWSMQEPTGCQRGWLHKVGLLLGNIWIYFSFQSSFFTHGGAGLTTPLFSFLVLLNPILAHAVQYK